MSGAKLSGDYDSEGNIEVWVQLLELAVIDYSNGNPDGVINEGAWEGNPGVAWDLITGRGYDDAQIGGFAEPPENMYEFLFTAEFISGETVTMSTPRFSEEDPRPIDLKTGNPIYGGHAYVFQGFQMFTKPSGVTVTAARLFNPHGIPAFNPQNPTMDRSGEVLVDIEQLISPYFDRIQGLHY